MRRVGLLLAISVPWLAWMLADLLLGLDRTDTITAVATTYYALYALRVTREGL